MPLPAEKFRAIVIPAKWRQIFTACAGSLFPLIFWCLLIGKEGQSKGILILAGVVVMYAYGLIMLTAAASFLKPTGRVHILFKLNWLTYVGLVALFAFLSLVFHYVLPLGFHLDPGTVTMMLIPLIAIFTVALVLLVKNFNTALKRIQSGHKHVIPKSAYTAIIAFTALLVVAWCFTHSWTSVGLALASINLSYAIMFFVFLRIGKLDRKQLPALVLCSLPGAVLFWMILDLCWPSNWNPLVLLLAGSAAISIGSNAIQRGAAKRLEKVVQELQADLAEFEGVTDPEQRAILDDLDKTMLYFRKRLVEYREEGLLDDVREK